MDLLQLYDNYNMLPTPMVISNIHFEDALCFIKLSDISLTGFTLSAQEVHRLKKKLNDI